MVLTEIGRTETASRCYSDFDFRFHSHFTSRRRRLTIYSIRKLASKSKHYEDLKDFVNPHFLDDWKLLLHNFRRWWQPCPGRSLWIGLWDGHRLWRLLSRLQGISLDSRSDYRMFSRNFLCLILLQGRSFHLRYIHKNAETTVFYSDILREKTLFSPLKS